MNHRKKNKGHRTYKIIKSTQVIAMAICPTIVHFTTQRGSRGRNREDPGNEVDQA